jgi:hypothetical protein
MKLRTLVTRTLGVAGVAMLATMPVALASTHSAHSRHARSRAADNSAQSAISCLQAHGVQVPQFANTTTDFKPWLSANSSNGTTAAAIVACLPGPTRVSSTGSGPTARNSPAAQNVDGNPTPGPGGKPAAA